MVFTPLTTHEQYMSSITQEVCMQNDTYEALNLLSKRITHLEGISSLLNWDQEVYMPKDANPIRAEQRKLLAELAHTLKTGPEFEKRLSSLIDLQSGKILHQGFDDSQKAALTEYRRGFLRFKKLPTSFVEELTALSSESMMVWQKAKSTNDYPLFEPYLAKIVSMQQQMAKYLGYKKHPYDALLEEYEPDATTEQIDNLFSEIKTALKNLLASLERKEKKTKELPPIPATDQEQIAICNLVLELVGFNFNRGRLDLSAHPFSSAYHPWDSRITTRLESHGMINQVLTTLHEVGHSFYEMGLPVEHWGTPLGQYASLGIHESQSRFWETRIGRALAFWKYLLPVLQKKFPNSFKNIEIDSFFKELNHVKPSLIRTDADEMTYPLHVILRFEIEKELIEGSLKTKDLPERWKSGMKELLGVVPSDDTTGCLQDIHWSMGAFGYFPTYTLGNVYAAELFESFAKQYPNWEERLSHGKFDFIKDWLQEKVWSKGRRYNGHNLIQQITGKPPTAKAYIHYLKEKYTSLFL